MTKHQITRAIHGYPAYPGHTISTASTPTCANSSRVAPIRSAGFSPLGSQALGDELHKANPASTIGVNDPFASSCLTGGHQPPVYVPFHADQQRTRNKQRAK